jgi:hypothetical protein
MISLKPQDIVVLLKLGLEPEDATRPFARLGADLGISASEVHASVTRTGAAGLADTDRRKPRVRNLLEFLEHGIRYVFISRRGEITRGFPTAHSAPPLNNLVVQGPSYQPGLLAKMYRSGEAHSNANIPPYAGALGQPGPLAKMYGNLTSTSPSLKDEPGILARMFGDPPLVWPHPEGKVRGESFEPLFPSAVDAARRDSKLYECLALVDALRIGRAREKKLAIDLLAKRLRTP